MAEDIPEQPNDRNSIRSAIFAHSKKKTLEVEAFGIKLEIYQPSMGEILDLQELPKTKDRVVASLINYCFVPGTKEKVFDITDTDSILALPFDENFEKINDAIAELTGVDLTEEELGNLEDDPSITTS